MSDKMYIIKINSGNLGQIVDGLKQRAEAYHITAEYYVTGSINDDQCIQEVKDEHEAIAIRDHYRDIVKDLESQMKRQNFMDTVVSEGQYQEESAASGYDYNKETVNHEHKKTGSTEQAKHSKKSLCRAARIGARNRG